MPSWFWQALLALLLPTLLAQSEGKGALGLRCGWEWLRDAPCSRDGGKEGFGVVWLQKGQLSGCVSTRTL